MLLFTVQFGLALALIGARGKAVAIVVDDLLHVLFKVLRIVIKLAPLGLLGAVAFTVGKYGLGSLKQLDMLVVLFYAAARIFVDAFSICITLAAVFIARAANTPVLTIDLLTIRVSALVTSKGSQDVPGLAVVVLAAALQAIPGLNSGGRVGAGGRLVHAYGRALGNLVGNCVAPIVIAARDGDIDRERAQAVLDGRPPPPREGIADLVARPGAA